MSKDRCPCGGIILADTEDWETPLCYSCFYELSIATKDFQKLQSQNAELIAALEFYANEKNWWWKSEAFGDLASRIICLEDISTTETCVKDGCGGKRARAVLRGIKGEVCD